jgi:biopolymer transport protein ExbB/biopolymer transport protein TolQ
LLPQRALGLAGAVRQYLTNHHFLEDFDIMVLLSQIWLAAGQLGLVLLQGSGDVAADFSLMGMIRHMGPTAIAVNILLLIMSIFSIAVMVERFLTYNAARAQSREFAPKVAQSLKQSRIEEAISVSDKYKKSHLAMVVNAGLQEFQAHQLSPDISGEEIDASKRAIQRAEAIKVAEFRRGLSSLATIGSTAPFVGLFGTVVGIINSFQQMKSAESAGIAAVAGGISEALFTTAFGLLVAVPAVWMFNYFTNKVDNFVVEMDNSSAELIDYFLKQRRGKK